MTGLHHLSGQFILLSVVAAGAGACYEITQGETVGKILPYYVVSFLGLYVYFSITGLVDIAGKKERLKVNLVDYLENHMANKLKQSEIDWEELTGETLSASKAKGRKKGKKKKEKDVADEKEIVEGRNRTFRRKGRSGSCKSNGLCAPGRKRGQWERRGKGREGSGVFPSGGGRTGRTFAGVFCLISVDYCQNAIDRKTII